MKKHFKNCRFQSFLQMSSSLCRRVWYEAIKLSIPFEFYTHINRGLKSCLVKVLSGSVENCRFWSTLKIVDFKLFFQMQSTLCRRVWSEAIKLELNKFNTHINQGLKSCLVMMSSRSVENRFWSTLKCSEKFIFR